MKICVVGAGRLGLPVALAMESRGHDVVVVDPAPAVADIIAARATPHEAKTAELWANSQIQLVPLAEGVADADIVFISVQTPHAPQYEGATPLPETRADFNYDALVRACTEVSMALQKPTPVAVISTVLPGTMARYIMPHVSPERFRLVYNPSFIAMGTVVRDFLLPEFTLLGSEDADALAIVRAFYETIHDRVIYETGVREAELIKVAYNTFITQKIVFANALMEICHKIGANVDAVTDGLALGCYRLLSPLYLAGGMGDGGGCHPRDNIALAWLGRELDLSANIFDTLVRAREQQSDWLAREVIAQAGDLPIVLMGEAFKRNSAITTGSAAKLLSAQLRERGINHRLYDPRVYPKDAQPVGPACYIIGCNHDDWHAFPFRANDLVIDPWREYRTVVEAAGARYVGIGAGQ